MFCLTADELLRTSGIGKQVNVKFSDGKTLSGTLQKLDMDQITVEDATGLNVPVFIPSIDSITFGTKAGSSDITRSDAIKFRNRCIYKADNAGLTLPQCFREEFLSCVKSSDSRYLADYLNAEVQQKGAAYTPEDVDGYMDALLRGEDNQDKKLGRSSAVFATIQFRLRKYDEAVMTLLQASKAAGLQATYLKLACLHSQMKSHSASLFWLDRYYSGDPDPAMFQDNIWWRYLRLCSRYGYYETQEAILTKMAQVSPRTAMESLAYLFMNNGNTAFTVQLLELAGTDPSLREAKEAIDTYSGFLQPDQDNNYHRYIRCMNSILSNGQCTLFEDMELISGYVYDYIPDRGFGFILGVDMISYFFRVESIDSENVLIRIKNNICSFSPVEDEQLVLVNFHRSRDSKRSYNAVQIV